MTELEQDMLAALEAAEDWVAKAGYMDRSKWQAVLGAIREAIAKAKDNQPNLTK